MHFPIHFACHLMLVRASVIVSLFLLLPFAGPLAPSEHVVTGTSYYVNCGEGEDRFIGTSANEAWRSLERANRAVLLPGDGLFLKRGCRWTAPLNVSWSGNPASPVYVGAYGAGGMPIIENGVVNVDITGSYVMVENILARITHPKRDPACDNNPVGTNEGFRLNAESSHVTLRGVKGTDMAIGAHVVNGSHHNHITTSTFSDNTMMQTLTRSHPNDDSGAWGILIEGDDNQIDHNTISGSYACSYDYGTDGAAIEIYGGQRNVMMYNKASQNMAFTELGNSRSSDNTYEHNVAVSTRDRSVFLVTRGAGDTTFGPVYHTKAYSNVGYFPSLFNRRTVHIVGCYRGCTPDILSFSYNIVWSSSRALYYDGSIDARGNLFFPIVAIPLLY
jgi:hypothetical protein